MKKQKRKKRKRPRKSLNKNAGSLSLRNEAIDTGKEEEPLYKTKRSYPKKEDFRRPPEQKKTPVYYMKKAIGFVQEAQMELRKVKWPTRKELMASTAMVLFLVLIVGLFLGLIDFGLIKLIRNIIQ